MGRPPAGDFPAGRGLSPLPGPWTAGVRPVPECSCKGASAGGTDVTEHYMDRGPKNRLAACCVGRIGRHERNILRGDLYRICAP